METPNQVTLHALEAGSLTLPERFFVHPADETARQTVPSLAFLIQHRNAVSGRKTRIVFDLGIRRDTARYPVPIQKHIANRHPLSTEPDVVASLAAGGLSPDDIDYVIYSHVHWDHVGEPRDFGRSIFVVGHGTVDLLNGKSVALRGGHSFFEADLLPPDRTMELPHPAASANDKITSPHGEPESHQGVAFSRPWVNEVHGPVACYSLDVFGDGTVRLIDAPGHLPGHLNLLVQMPDTMIYLAGDACHDRRILRRECEIGQWLDDAGHICCIHADKRKAEETLERIRSFEAQGIEVIFAHDVDWVNDSRNSRRFFGYSVDE